MLGELNRFLKCSGLQIFPSSLILPVMLSYKISYSILCVLCLTTSYSDAVPFYSSLPCLSLCFVLSAAPYSGPPEEEHRGSERLALSSLWKRVSDDTKSLPPDPSVRKEVQTKFRFQRVCFPGGLNIHHHKLYPSAL